MKENYQDCIGTEDHIESMTEVLHYLESLQPHQLLEQMFCTAFKAAADTLIQTSYGELKQMETMMQQLYLTMAPALMPLQASLCRKFLQVPRLAREIFSDFYNFYIPRMGIGLTEDALTKEFDTKQEVWNKEREVVSKTCLTYSN